MPTQLPRRLPNDRARRPRLDPDTAAIRLAVRSAIAPAPAGALVLVGVSGGADSLALALAARFETAAVGMRAGAVIVDHGLQPGSAEVARATADLLQEAGLDPVVVVRVEVRSGGGPEAAARKARYAALAAQSREVGAWGVLLGHTLDDQAETVLLGLARGSGISALSGMRPVAEGAARWMRPLLAIERAQTARSCRALGIEPWSDPQNADLRFARVRARLNALPALERELGPGIARALARSAALLQDDEAALAGQGQVALERIRRAPGAPLGGAVELDRVDLRELPAAIAGRVIRLATREAGGGAASAAQVGGVLRLVHRGGPGTLDLPGTKVEVTASRVVFGPQRPAT